MAKFKYKAVNTEGKTIRGSIDAVNNRDLEARLNHMDMELITASEVTDKSGIFSGNKISRQELINFCFHMEQLSAAGIPILESLTDLRDSLENPRFKEIMTSMITSIQGGKTLSQALAEFPSIFDKVFVSLVEAGEHSGELSRVLQNLTESLKYQDELISQSKKLIMYPVFVGAIVLSVIFFLMIYLVPQMVSFIKSMGEELPMHTQVLIFVSDFFVSYWYLLISVPILLAVSLLQAAKYNNKIRYMMDMVKLKVWLIGPILRKIILGRFATYFALLYSSGVTILSCVEISEKIAGNEVIAEALRNVRKATSDGQSLSSSIENVYLFPPLVLRMLRVGENTGNLDAALMNVSYFYNREVKESIEKLQTMIEPAMTVALGMVLGWVMLSVLGPIYDIVSRIQS